MIELSNNGIKATIIGEPVISNPSKADRLPFLGSDVEILDADVPVDGWAGSVEPYAFTDCTGLCVARFKGGLRILGQGAFADCPRLQSSDFLQTNLQTIGSEAFRNCTTLRQVHLPDTVETIGDYAFAGCRSLKTFTIPPNCRTIGGFAFDGCMTLNHIDIPESVVTVWEWAFRNTGIESATVHESTELMEDVFPEGCNVTFLGSGGIPPRSWQPKWMGWNKPPWE